MTDTNEGRSLGPKRATFALWKWCLVPIVGIFVILVIWTFVVQGIKWVRSLNKECPKVEQVVTPCKCKAPEEAKHECKKAAPKRKQRVQVTPSPPPKERIVYIPSPAPPPIVVEKVVEKIVQDPAPPPTVIVKERLKTHIIHEEVEDEPTHEYRRTVRRPRVEYEEEYYEPPPRRRAPLIVWNFPRYEQGYRDYCPPQRPQYRPQVWGGGGHTWNPPRGGPQHGPTPGPSGGPQHGPTPSMGDGGGPQHGPAGRR